MKSKDENAVLSCIGAMVTVPLVILTSIVVNGVTLVYLWRWFMTDVFSVKLLSLPEALGVSLLWSFFIKNLKNDDSFKKTGNTWLDLFSALVIQICTCLFLLGMGWLIRRFIGQ